MGVGDAYVFPGFLTQVLNNFSFQSHRLVFSDASAEVRGENTPERSFASTEDRTHNHQVVSPTRSQLSHPGGATSIWKRGITGILLKNVVNILQPKAIADDTDQDQTARNVQSDLGSMPPAS